MADEDVATKAPENDAQETSGITGDTKPDQGAASMGEHCTTDRPSPPGQTPTGEITEYDHVQVYVTKPADYPHSPCKLLLLLTGGTGIQSTNNQLQADKFAAEGFLVVMPDQFGGYPAPTTTTTTGPAEQNPSMIEQIKLGVANVAKLFTIDMWLAYHTPEKVLPILHKVIAAVKDEFGDAIANGGGIYAAGYCFGAKYVLLLGSSTKEQGTTTESEAEEGLAKQVGPFIKVGAIAHGTQITTADFEDVTVPTTIVAVENDPFFPDAVRDGGKKVLEAKGAESELKIYSDVPHGFAVLGDYGESVIVEKQKEAFEQMLAWLQAH